jgi:hypothetical protein
MKEIDRRRLVGGILIRMAAAGLALLVAQGSSHLRLALGLVSHHSAARGHLRAGGLPC